MSRPARRAARRCPRGRRAPTASPAPPPGRSRGRRRRRASTRTTTRRTCTRPASDPAAVAVELEQRRRRLEADQRAVDQPADLQQPAGAVRGRGEQRRPGVADDDRAADDGDRGHRLGNRVVRPGRSSTRSTSTAARCRSPSTPQALTARGSPPTTLNRRRGVQRPGLRQRPADREAVLLRLGREP